MTTPKLKEVRLGIAGLGKMGAQHAERVQQGKIPGLVLRAVCDIAPDLAARFPGQKAFCSPEAMIDSGEIDAILIATPHFSHTSIGIAALKAGLHVLVEKPVSVHKADGERLLAAHTDPSLIFAANFVMRTYPAFQKIKSMIDEGELGEIRRINWIVTTWFRPEAYYNLGGWRGTWGGEGGGVLLNQCPHQLDLWQWLFGMPSRIYAKAAIGRYHAIEVEDDVNAFMEYDDGKTGVFITSTGETPGTNRLEITGEKGRLVLDQDAGGTLVFARNDVPMSEFSRTTPNHNDRPSTTTVHLAIPKAVDRHESLFANFTAAILEGAPLLAPAAEGVHSVELANAMLLSSLRGTAVDLPICSQEFERELNTLIAGSQRKQELNHV